MATQWNLDAPQVITEALAGNDIADQTQTTVHPYANCRAVEKVLNGSHCFAPCANAQIKIFWC
jgi:hypothetical protein